MLLKIMVEIIALWIIFFLFMWLLVGRGRGPLGGIQYYSFLIIVYLYRSLMRGEILHTGMLYRTSRSTMSDKSIIPTTVNW